MQTAALYWILDHTSPAYKTTLQTTGKWHEPELSAVVWVLGSECGNKDAVTEKVLVPGLYADMLEVPYMCHLPSHGSEKPKQRFRDKGLQVKISLVRVSLLYSFHFSADLKLLNKNYF